MSTSTPGNGTAVSPRLSMMMFLQYAVWGAWLPVLGRYLDAHLGFENAQIGMILGTAAAVGALTAPLIGQVADRYLSAERALGLLILVGAIITWFMASAKSVNTWVILSAAYSIAYMPTISLSNSLAFSHLKDPENQFPRVRVWGTIGWIAVSWAFPMVWLQTDLQFTPKPPFLKGDEITDALPRLADSLRLSAMIAAAYGVYCFTLPNTPPKKSVESLAVADALRLLGKPGMFIVTLVALPISVLHTIYFIQTSQFLGTLPGIRDADIGPAMSLGQFSEILMLAILGIFLKKAGFRIVMTVGCLAYAGRYYLFSIAAPTSMVVSSQALHGLCFACFYATAFLYVERISPASVRHSAQTVFGLIVLGVGPLLVPTALGKITAASTLTTNFGVCATHVEYAPVKPSKDDGGWDMLMEGGNEAVEAYAKANPSLSGRAWVAMDADIQVEALDYGKFWRICAIIGLICAGAVLLLFRMDPPGDPEPDPSA